MKKKLIFTAVAAILVIGIVFGIVACNKNNGSATDSLENPFVENYVEMDYSEVNGYTEVEGLDAFDVLVSAYNSWVNNTAYRRIEAFDFVASVSTLGAHQQSMSVYKRDGEEFYKEDVTITTGVQTDNIGEREYYDGNKVYSIYFNDKNRAPGNEDNLFAVTDWGDFAEWQPGDRYEDFDDMKYSLLEEFNSYAWQDRTNYADNCDYTVYEKDGLYYFTLTLDCSKEAMDTVHTVARDEIIAGTGGIPGTLNMVQNTKIDIIVKPMADNSYRFEAWRRTEKYEGDRTVLFTVTAKCQQTTLTVFDYEEADYSITDADKLNLA